MPVSESIPTINDELNQELNDEGGLGETQLPAASPPDELNSPDVDTVAQKALSALNQAVGSLPGDDTEVAEVTKEPSESEPDEPAEQPIDNNSNDFKNPESTKSIGTINSDTNKDTETTISDQQPNKSSISTLKPAENKDVSDNVTKATAGKDSVEPELALNPKETDQTKFQQENSKIDTVDEADKNKIPDNPELNEARKRYQKSFDSIKIPDEYRLINEEEFGSWWKTATEKISGLATKFKQGASDSARKIWAGEVKPHQVALTSVAIFIPVMAMALGESGFNPEMVEVAQNVEDLVRNITIEVLASEHVRDIASTLSEYFGRLADISQHLAETGGVVSEVAAESNSDQSTSAVQSINDLSNAVNNGEVNAPPLPDNPQPQQMPTVETISADPSGQSVASGTAEGIGTIAAEASQEVADTLSFNINQNGLLATIQESLSQSGQPFEILDSNGQMTEQAITTMQNFGDGLAQNPEASNMFFKSCLESLFASVEGLNSEHLNAIGTNPAFLEAINSDPAVFHDLLREYAQNNQIQIPENAFANVAEWLRVMFKWDMILDGQVNTAEFSRFVDIAKQNPDVMSEFLQAFNIVPPRVEIPTELAAKFSLSAS